MLSIEEIESLPLNEKVRYIEQLEKSRKILSEKSDAKTATGEEELELIDIAIILLEYAGFNENYFNWLDRW